jgi:release factor glutamine methyltransferase
MAPTIAEALTEGARILREAGVPTPRGESSLLLRTVLEIDQTQLVVRTADSIPPVQLAAFLALIHRRAAGEPPQYITRRQEFYGLDFLVTPDVLIPRPETEFLVEKVIALGRELEGADPGSPVVADIGTGSGCIAVAIASNLPKTRVIATDVSEPALAIARENALRHQVQKRIEFLEGDALEPLARLSLQDSIDVIASNPPYVPEATFAGLQREVRDFEPRVALSGGESGLLLFDRLLAGSGGFLKPRGALVVEIGYSQLDAVTKLAGCHRMRVDEVTFDLQGIPRTLVIRRGD